MSRDPVRSALGIPTPEPAVSLPVAEIMDLLSKVRIAHGLGLLVVRPTLVAMEEAYAAEMADHDQLTHGSGVEAFGARLKASGYDPSASAAENVAAGLLMPADVVAAWLASPAHRFNMLDRAFTDVGAGMAASASGQVYWAVAFGSGPMAAIRRFSVPPGIRPRRDAQ